MQCGAANERKEERKEWNGRKERGFVYFIRQGIVIIILTRLLIFRLILPLAFVFIQSLAGHTSKQDQMTTDDDIQRFVNLLF